MSEHYQVYWKYNGDTEWRKGRVIGPTIGVASYIASRNRAWEGEKIFKVEPYVEAITPSDTNELTEFLRSVVK